MTLNDVPEASKTSILGVSGALNDVSTYHDAFDVRDYVLGEFFRNPSFYLVSSMPLLV
jgi:hypothetical protein